MLDALPRRAFFRFEFPLHRLASLPIPDASANKWKPKYLLPPLIELEDQPAICDVYAGWCDEGLAIAYQVPERSGRLNCAAEEWWKRDGLRVCIDTRDARDIKRASRFCHFFYFLPCGGGRDHKTPIVGFHRMSRAKDVPPAPDLTRITVAARIQRNGYSLEAFIPAACLHGWDPAEHPRIGFFYKVNDTVLGAQHFTVTDALGWNVDPSTWSVAVLTP